MDNHHSYDTHIGVSPTILRSHMTNFPAFMRISLPLVILSAQADDVSRKVLHLPRPLAKRSAILMSFYFEQLDNLESCLLANTRGKPIKHLFRMLLNVYHNSPKMRNTSRSQTKFSQINYNKPFMHIDVCFDSSNFVTECFSLSSTCSRRFASSSNRLRSFAHLSIPLTSFWSLLWT